MSELSDIKRSIESLTNCVHGISDTLAKAQRPSMKTMPRELTDEECVVLLDIAASEDPQTHCQEKQGKDSGAYAGMLLDLASLGCLTAVSDWNGNVIVNDVTTRGLSAVERFKHREARAEKAIKRGWRHDFFVALFSGALGILGTMGGVLLGSSIG